MNIRKLLFISTNVFIVLLIIAVFVTFTSIPSSPGTKTPLPTDTQLLQPNKGEFLLSSLTPPNNSVDIALSVKPTFRFTTSIEETSPVVTITPNTPFTYSINSNEITILPSSNLFPSTRYDVSLEINRQAFFVSFVTAGPEPTSAPDTKDTELLEQQQEELKTQRPDIYLSNSTPYNGENISVTSFFTTSPTGHFRFNVTSKNADTAQTDFSLWAQGKGLTGTQIASLDVVYN